MLKYSWGVYSLKYPHSLGYFDVIFLKINYLRKKYYFEEIPKKENEIGKVPAKQKMAYLEQETAEKNQELNSPQNQRRLWKNFDQSNSYR